MHCCRKLTPERIDQIMLEERLNEIWVKNFFTTELFFYLVCNRVAM
jgi:hypothetical protein